MVYYLKNLKDSMKLLLITDQHFGVRNDSPAYIDQYRKFYKDTVLPYIDKNKITHIVNLGDTFDKRKSINYSSLDAAKEMWFDPVRDRGCLLYTSPSPRDRQKSRMPSSA